jgi:hypothetical protein
MSSVYDLKSAQTGELAAVRAEASRLSVENATLKEALHVWVSADRSRSDGYVADRAVFMAYCRVCMTHQERLKKGVAFMLPEDTF